MPSSHFSASWRVAAILGVMVSALATETFAFPGRNDSSPVDGPLHDNATDVYKDSGKVIAVPLRRVSQKGMATPSLAKRFFKSEVLGVFGAAYLAECMLMTIYLQSPSSRFMPLSPNLKREKDGMV